MNTDFTGFEKQIEELEMDSKQKAENVAEGVAESVVNHARSLTSQTKPGVKSGEGFRRVHPGGWADITGNLANSIKSRVEWEGQTVIGIVEAGMEYAAYLDALEGIDVLGGADQIIKRAVKKYEKLL